MIQNITEYWRQYSPAHKKVVFFCFDNKIIIVSSSAAELILIIKVTHYFTADGKDHRNDQKGSMFHKVLPHHFFRFSIFQFYGSFLVNFLKNCVSQQQTRFRQGHLISYVHVQKEAGADDDSVHEGSQSPYCQPSISQFKNSLRLILQFGNSLRLVFECFQFWSF